MGWGCSSRAPSFNCTPRLSPYNGGTLDETSGSFAAKCHARLATTLRKDTTIAMISSQFRLKPQETFGSPWSVQLPCKIRPSTQFPTVSVVQTRVTTPLHRSQPLPPRIDPSHYATALLIASPSPICAPYLFPRFFFVRFRNEQPLAGCNSISRIQMKGKLNLLFCRNNPHFFYSVFTSPSANSQRIKANSERLRIARNYRRNISLSGVGQFSYTDQALGGTTEESGFDFRLNKKISNLMWF